MRTDLRKVMNGQRCIAEICADYDRKRIQEKRERPFKLLAELYLEFRKPIRFHAPPIARVIETISQKNIDELHKCLKENGFEKLLKEKNMKVFVVTCYMEGCEECGNERHVVGVALTYKKAEEMRKKHEKDIKSHIHSFYCEITEVEISE